MWQHDLKILMLGEKIHYKYHTLYDSFHKKHQNSKSIETKNRFLLDRGLGVSGSGENGE